MYRFVCESCGTASAWPYSVLSRVSPWDICADCKIDAALQTAEPEDDRLRFVQHESLSPAARATPESDTLTGVYIAGALAFLVGALIAWAVWA